MADQPSLTEKELAELRTRYATGEVTFEEMEGETEFWLEVADCEFCDAQLCTSHYGQYVGR